MLKKRFSQQSIKIFLFSFLESIRIGIIGQMPLSGIFALINSLSIRSWIKTFRTIPDIKKISFAYLSFFLAQVTSDIVNHSNMHDMLRGWANILMAIVLLTFLVRMLWRSSSLIIIFLIGEIISMILFGPTIVHPTGDTFGSMAYFKFRIAPILNALVLIGLWYLLKKKSSLKLMPAIILFIYGILCLAFAYRSVGIFMIITGIILLNKNLFKRLSNLRMIIYAVIFLIIFQGLYVLYVNQVLYSGFGENHSKAQLVRVGNPYNPFDLLKTGRAETYVALYAIAAKPILGYGSWAPDLNFKYHQVVAELHFQGENTINYNLDGNSNTIPSHSVLLGAWVYSGIVGFIAMLYIFCLYIKRGISLLRDSDILKSPYLPIIIFFLLSGFWAFLFSPLPSIRYDLPIKIAFIMTLFQKKK